MAVCTMAQSFVSTVPSKRNVLMEEYTGNASSNLRLSVNGTQIVRNKTIAPYCTDTVQIANLSVDNMPAEHQNYTQTATVAFLGYTSNGTTVNLSDESLSVTYGNADIYTAAGPLTLTIRYDSYPSEISYSLAGMSDCQFYYQYTGVTSDAGNTRNYTLSPATAGLYRLKMYDTGGDGLSGTVSVKDAQGNTLFTRSGNNLMVWDNDFFNITTAGTDGPQGEVPTSIEEFGTESTSWTVWPNPVRETLHLDSEATLQRAELMDISGRTILTTTEMQLNVTVLPAGLYLLRIVDENGVYLKKSSSSK